MAQNEKPVHEQVADLLSGWNPAPVDHTLERLVGIPTEEGDGRATATVRPEEMDHGRNSGADDVDAERQFQDDGDDEDETEDYSDEDTWTFQALKDEIDLRNEDREDDDHISKGGSAADLRERLIEDDNTVDEEGDESDDDDE